MRTIRLSALAALGLLAAGCAIGPDYARPPAETPPAFKEGLDWKVAQPADDRPRGAWWSIYADPVLDDLMAKLAAGNFNLQAAEARHRQARAALASAQSSFFPAISAGANATRSRQSSGSLGIDTGINRNYRAEVDLRWEIDLWGRVRRSVEAGRASMEASAGDYESAKLSLQAALAQAYFSLRVADAQRQLLEDTVTAYARSLELTRNRYAAGVAGKVEVVQAEAQLLSTQAQAIDLNATRAQLEHAIAVLLGQPPAAFSLAAAPLATEVPRVPPGLPSALLERRPDIAAAERRVAAANAQIGVATAAYFPTLTFPATLGYSSASFSDWVAASSRLWSFGPALAFTVLDFGARGAAVDSARASWEQSVAAYRQTVLEAFQEVEDNLAALRFYEAEARVQGEAVRASRETVQLTTNQYKAGTANYLAVVVVQASQLGNERAAVSLLGRRLAASVALVAAIGGSWDGSLEGPPPAKPAK